MIRTADRQDAGTLARLGAATFVETFGHLYTPQNLAAHLAKNHVVAVYDSLLPDDRWGLWLVESEKGEALGYCVAGPCSLPVPEMPEDSGELARLYLLKEAHGAGLGARMLTIALDWMGPRFAHIYLSVYKENLVALRLYEGFGFVKIHDYFYMVGDHADPEWIMQFRR